jgi:hypothetical protein
MLNRLLSFVPLDGPPVLGRVRRRTLLPDAGVRGVDVPASRSSRRPLLYGDAPSVTLRGVLFCGGSGSKHDRRRPSNRCTTSGMSRRAIIFDALLDNDFFPMFSTVCGSTEGTGQHY